MAHLTPQELRAQIMQKRADEEEWLATNWPADDEGEKAAETKAESQGDDVTTDEEEGDEVQQDLYEALDLLGQLGEKLLRCLKVDKAHKSLTQEERREMQELLGEAQLFTEQWEWNEDKE